MHALKDIIVGAILQSILNSDFWLQSLICRSLVYFYHLQSHNLYFQSINFATLVIVSSLYFNYNKSRVCRYLWFCTGIVIEYVILFDDLHGYIFWRIDIKRSTYIVWKSLIHVAPHLISYNVFSFQKILIDIIKQWVIDKHCTSSFGCYHMCITFFH